MRASALSSGSDGNCFYIEEEENAILIDAGINNKNIHQKLKEIKADPKKIKGIFITHEHIDHIRGSDVFARTYNIPIFATKGTIKSGFLCSDNSLLNEINNQEIISFSKFCIETIPKFHKAADPVSFVISSKEKKVSVLTDIGKVCENVSNAINKSNAIYLESNHDLNMLKNGPYPHFLKNWISGDTGHLSNNQASLASLEFSKPKLKNIVLSHLSKVNNSPEVAKRTFSQIMKERKDFSGKISISTEISPTPLIEI